MTQPAALRSFLVLFIFLLLQVSPYGLQAATAPVYSINDKGFKTGFSARTGLQSSVLLQPPGTKWKAKLSGLVTRMLSRVNDRTKVANRKARLGFVLSLVGLLLVPILPTIPGMILCIAALSEEKRAPGTLTRDAKSLAQVGIVLGAISLAVLMIVLLVIAGMTHR